MCELVSIDYVDIRASQDAMDVATGERCSNLDDFSFEAVLRRLDQSSDATTSTSRDGRDDIERVIQDAFDALDRCGAHLRRRMEGEVLKRIQMQLKSARSRDGERRLSLIHI